MRIKNKKIRKSKQQQKAYKPTKRLKTDSGIGNMRWWLLASLTIISVVVVGGCVCVCGISSRRWVSLIVWMTAWRRLIGIMIVVVVEWVLKSSFAWSQKSLEKMSTRIDCVVACAHWRFVKIYRVMMLELWIAVRFEVNYN